MLELVVRPFQLPQFSWPPQIPAAAGVTMTTVSGNGRLCWGAAGKMPTPSAGISFCVNTQQEQQRTTEQIRIYQNGDNTSPNFVDVERALEIDFNDAGTAFDPTSSSTDYVAADLAEYDAEESALFSVFNGTSTQTSCKTAMKLNNSGSDFT